MDTLGLRGIGEAGSTFDPGSFVEGAFATIVTLLILRGAINAIFQE